MQAKTILRYIGLSLVAVSIMMIVSAFVAILVGDNDSLMPLLYSGLITLITGMYPIVFVTQKRSLSVSEGYVILTGTWFFACLFGALPYILNGPEISFTDALFESVSGFTTTGASVISDIEALPKGLLFWRIASSWIGGIGIITLLSLVVSARDDQKNLLSNIEGSEISEDLFGLNRKNTVSKIVITYILITSASCLSLKIAGMGWFDAAIHAMSACSTCGFSTKGTSLAYFHSHTIEAILCVSMLLGAINFSLVFATICLNKRKNIFKSEIVRTFMIILGIIITIIAINLFVSGKADTIFDALMLSAFQVISLATTTGFATADTNTWPSLCIVLLCICSVVCGCSGSTSGGMKIDRLIIIAKGIKYKITAMLHPSWVKYVRMEGVFLSEQTRSEAADYAMIYTALIGIGVLVNTSAGCDLITSISSSVACIGNVGPGFGEVGSMNTYSNLPTIVKYSSMVLMLLGRLEIYPLFASVVTLTKLLHWIR